ncbi:MAG TPA: response regulator, partial [Nitrososphaeraceae archaeon]|nr:response regulator [Nitrososphaeraceae archaeon]
NEGYNTLSFTDPTLAYEYFRQTKTATPSLLITDMRMPGLDGIDLARRVREIDKDIKIFLMTAFEVSDLEDQPGYKEAKINKLLQKPIHFHELRNMITDTLRTND